MNPIVKSKKTFNHKVRIIKGKAHKDGKEYKSWTHYEYDSKGKISHEKYSDGYEKWYDSNGNIIRVANIDGDMRKYEYDYDFAGNLIHEIDFLGVEDWYDYDAHGNEIHYNNANGYELWNDYDSNGNRIHTKDTNGYECWYEYDAKGNRIHNKDSYGIELWNKYDVHGNRIHYKDSNGHEMWSKYIYKKVKGKYLTEWIIFSEYPIIV